MRRAVLSLVPSAVLGTGAAAIGLTDNWDSVGVPVGDANFGDLKVIFVAAQCASTDPTWSATSEPCLPGMSHYNYPSVWAKTFGLFSADPTWTPIVAAILMGLFTLSLVPLTWFALAGRREITAVAGITVTAVTPPVWLAFQRGNIDLLMFFLVSAAICLWVARATKAAAAVIGIATLLKIFPIGAAVMLFSRQRPRRGALLTFIIVVLLAGIINFNDFAAISERTPQIDGASFGIGLLPLLASNQLDLGWSTTVIRILGVFIFTVACTLALMAVRRRYNHTPWTRLMEAISDNSATTALVLAGSGVFLMAYLLGPSYDYRLIFLIPVIAGLLRVGSTFAVASASILILQMILSYSTYIGPGEYLSDVMLLAIAPLMTVTVIRILQRARR